MLCRQDFARNLLEAKINFASAQLQSRQPACLLAIRNGGGEGGCRQRPPKYAGICILVHHQIQRPQIFLEEIFTGTNEASEERTTLSWLLIDYGI